MNLEIILALLISSLFNQGYPPRLRTNQAYVDKFNQADFEDEDNSIDWDTDDGHRYEYIPGY